MFTGTLDATNTLIIRQLEDDHLVIYTYIDGVIIDATGIRSGDRWKLCSGAASAFCDLNDESIYSAMRKLWLETSYLHYRQEYQAMFVRATLDTQLRSALRTKETFEKYPEHTTTKKIKIKIKRIQTLTKIIQWLDSFGNFDKEAIIAFQKKLRYTRYQGEVLNGIE